MQFFWSAPKCNYCAQVYTTRSTFDDVHVTQTYAGPRGLTEVEIIYSTHSEHLNCLTTVFNLESPNKMKFQNKSLLGTVYSINLFIGFFLPL